MPRPNTTDFTAQPTLHTVADVVRQVTRIKNVPLYETFSNLGLTSQQLQRVQIQLLKTFNRTVRLLKFTDTVDTVTQELLSTKS